MNQQQLQSQISLNRNHINTLHNAIHSFKLWREKAHKEGDEQYAKLLTKGIQKASRQISQYVALQKALKKKLAQSIVNHRCSFFVEQNRFEEFLTKVVKEHPEMFDATLKVSV